MIPFTGDRPINSNAMTLAAYAIGLTSHVEQIGTRLLLPIGMISVVGPTRHVILRQNLSQAKAHLNFVGLNLAINFPPLKPCHHGKNASGKSAAAREDRTVRMRQMIRRLSFLG